MKSAMFFRSFVVIIFVWMGLSCGFPIPFREYVPVKNVTNFTLADDTFYFGAGYHLYALNTTNNELKAVYHTDRLRVEQPLKEKNSLFFGGLRGYGKGGWRGEPSGFFAYDVNTRKLRWKFALDSGYGTYGTFPVFANEKILVCGREHLYALDKETGKELWKVDNWMGSTGHTVNIPYVFGQNVYYKISEELVANSKTTDENDGHWAEVDLSTGRRTIFPIAQHPGTYEDSSGEGIGVLVDGILYGNNRVDSLGAIDLNSKRVLWEIKTDSQIKPAANEDKIYIVQSQNVEALDKETGKTIWKSPLNGLSKPVNDYDRYEEYSARRVTIGGKALIVQGSLGVGAFDLITGKELWKYPLSSRTSPVIPVVIGSKLYVVSGDDCSIVVLDIDSGTELTHIQIPDCTSYLPIDD